MPLAHSSPYRVSPPTVLAHILFLVFVPNPRRVSRDFKKFDPRHQLFQDLVASALYMTMKRHTHTLSLCMSCTLLSQTRHLFLQSLVLGFDLVEPREEPVFQVLNLRCHFWVLAGRTPSRRTRFGGSVCECGRGTCKRGIALSLQ